MRQDRKKSAAIPVYLLQLIGKPLLYVLLLCTIGLITITKIVTITIVRIHKLLRSIATFLSSPKHQKTTPIPTPNKSPFTKTILKWFYAHIIVRFTKLTSHFNSLKQNLSAKLHRTKQLTDTLFVNIKAAIPSFRFPSVNISQPKIPKLKKPQIPIQTPKVSIPQLKPGKPSIALVSISILVIGLSLSLYTFILKDLPHPKELINRPQRVTTKIFDRNHRLLYKVYKNENRTIVGLDTIPKHAVLATLAIEDSEFYQHVGFSIRGIARAAQRNLTQEKLQGGSTITQQLVKNTLLTPEKTMQRKIKELFLSLAVENYFTKDEILTMYFNQVGYGGTAYGIEEAAQYYFGKSVKNINLAEASLLAGLPAAPTIYSPFGANPELAIARQHEVLRRMVEEGYISRSTAEDIKTTPLEFTTPTTDIEAPHFVMYVKDKLVNLYGEQAVNQGGLEVITSIDLDIQQLAEVSIQEELEKLNQLNVTNAAVLITSPKTGEVLAMAGSHDYFDTAGDGQVNVTLRPRQPGSSIKVITYTLALENDFTPSTMIQDSPVTYNSPGSPPYSPKNYDNRFHGNVTLRQALANSYNVPAVKTLSQLGVQNMIDKANTMGITTWNDPSRFGLSLTLGGGEVKMVDMAVVYGSLANMGTRVDLNPILEISDYAHVYDTDFACDSSSNLIAQAEASSEICTGNQAVDPKAAYIITDILSDNQARSAAFGSNSVLNIPGHKVAVKTGTTNSLRDNWTIGYTGDYVIVVWVGNNDNTPMSYVASGITGASPIWNRIMTALLEENPHPEFDRPADLVKATICPLTGTLTCGACPNPKTEYFIAGTQPTRACSDDQINRILNPQEENPDQPRDQILEGASTDPKPTKKPRRIPRPPNFRRN